MTTGPGTPIHKPNTTENAGKSLNSDNRTPELKWAGIPGRIEHSYDYVNLPAATHLAPEHLTELESP